MKEHLDVYLPYRGKDPTGWNKFFIMLGVLVVVMVSIVVTWFF